uniref:CSON006028 protein n=1 Tax=Culicoides sonorensis TaxID=179676 RepID=A0A336K189_CULSO
MNFVFWFINVIIALILLYLKLRISRRKLYDIADKIPGPPAWPLIGAMYLFFGKNNEDILKEVDKILTKYKSPAKAWFGPVLAILVDSPPDLKVILNSPHCLQKAFPYQFLRVDCGLMAAPVDMWKTHRKYLNPCFNPKLLQSFLPIFNQKSRVMADRLATKLGEDEFDIYTTIGRCTLDMICGTAMGWEDCDLQNHEGDMYLESAEKIAENVNQRIFNILLHPFPIYKLTKLFRDEEMAWQKLKSYTTKVIHNFKRKQQRKKIYSDKLIEDLKNNNKNDTENDDQEFSGLRKPKVFVDKVFELAEKLPEFNNQCITDEIDTLMAGCLINENDYSKMPVLDKYEDFEECQRNFRENFTYCVVYLKIVSNTSSDLWKQIEEFSSHQQFHFRHDSLKRGICLNNYQNTKDIEDGVDTTLKNYITHELHDGFGLLTEYEIKHVMTHETEQQRMAYDTLDMTFVVIFIILLLCSFIGTISHFIRLPILSPTVKKGLSSFDLNFNIKRLFENVASETDFIHSIRVISEQAVVVIHIFVLFPRIGLEKPLLLECEAHQPYTAIFGSLVILIQNFFLLSGFLSFYLNAKKIIVQNEQLHLRDFIMMILKRIVRLLPLMALMMFYNATLQLKFGSNPIYIDIMENEKKNCRRNWWTNVMFINNIYRADEPCLQQTWHVAVEMQLFVMELIILMIINYKPKRTGVILMGVFIFTNVSQILYTFKYKLVGIFLANLEDQRTSFYLNDAYHRAHIHPITNTSGYVIGMLIAYIQLNISKNGIKLNENKYFNRWKSFYLLPYLPDAIYSYYVYFGYADSQLSPLLISIFSTAAKNLSVIPAATVILLLLNQETTNDKSMIRTITDWYIFKPLSKVNYGIYIVHLGVILQVLLNNGGDTLLKYGSISDILVYVYPFSLFAMTGVAAVMFVLVELPIINTFKLIYYKQKCLEMISIEQIFVITVITLLIFYYNFSRWSLYRAASKIPGENGLPLIGSVHEIFFTLNNTNIFELLHKSLDDYGSPCKVWYGNMLSIFVEKPSQLQVILNSDKCLEKQYLYKFLGVDKGLIASKGKLMISVQNPKFNGSFSHVVISTLKYRVN